MNSLKALKVLIHNLTKKEISILISNLNQHVKNEELGSKSIQLVKLLTESNSNNFSEIQNIIYGKDNYNAFSKLINRLKDKIFEIILMDNSLKSNSFSERNIILINLRKKLLQADILQLKGERANIGPVYSHIIKYAKKFELYEVLVQALNSYQRLHSISTKSKKFKNINAEIKYAEECLIAFKESFEIYKEITNMISNSIAFNEYSKSLINSIDKMENYYNKTHSSTIGFYLFTLKTELYQNNENYLAASTSLEKVKDILLKSESAYTRNRYGVALLNLANNNIYLNNFDKGIKLANESKLYFKNLPLTLKIVDEILFYCYFYKNDFINCEVVLSNIKFVEDRSIKSKFEYYKACNSFMTGKFEDSINQLVNSLEIEKDKEGWNINKRILLILNRIELNDYESVDLQIQNLEKFIKRVSKNKVIKFRFIIILRILSSLLRDNLDFEAVYFKKRKYFDLLNSNESQYKWDIKSPELINFPNWFRTKLKITKFDKN
jgi:hypothetical protein